MSIGFVFTAKVVKKFRLWVGYDKKNWSCLFLIRFVSLIWGISRIFPYLLVQSK